MYKKKKVKLRKRFNTFIMSIFPQTITVMNSFILPLVVAFVYISFIFVKAASVDIVMAKDEFAPVFQHLWLTFVIVICGSALLDVTLRETEK